MPHVGPISRRNLVRFLRELGFVGPQDGGKHQYMEHPDGRRVRIPNPHRSDVGTGLLLLLLREAETSREQWERL